MTARRLSRLFRAALAAAVVAIPLALWAVLTVDDRARVLADAQLDAGRVAATAAEHATRLLETQAIVLDLVDRLAGDRDCAALRDDRELQAFMATAVRRAAGIETVWVLDRDGFFCAASDPARMDARSRAAREYFTESRNAAPGQYVVGRAITGMIGAVPAFNLARRRGEDAAFGGIVLAAVDLRDLLRHWGTTLNALPTQRIALFRRDGATVARSWEPLVPAPDAEAERRIAQAWATRPEGTTVAASPVDGERRVGAWRTLRGWDVVTTATLSEREALRPWREVALRSGVLAVFASLLLGLVAGWLIGARRRLEAANATLEDRVLSRTAALREGEGRLRLALETAALGIVEWDLRASTVRLDRGAAAVFRGTLPADRPLALDGPERIAWRERIHPEDLPPRDRRRAALHAGEVDTAEGLYRVRLPAPDGTEEWTFIVSRGAVVARDDDGRPLRILDVVQDVTARRRAEAALRESDERLRAVLDNVPVAVVLAEAPSGRIVFGNPGVERVFRHPLRLSGDPDDYVEWEGYHPDGRRMEGREYPLARVLETGEPASQEVHYACGDGVRRWLLVEGAPVRDEAGRMTGAIVVCTDIDDRRRAEAARQEAEARFRISQDLSPLPFSILHAVRNADGKVEDFVFDYVNPAAARVLQWPVERLEGERQLRLFPDHANHPLLFPRYVAVLREEDDGAEVEIDYHEGDPAGWFRNAVTRLDADRLAVSFQDITASKEAERRGRFLLELTDRLRAAPRDALAAASDLLGHHLRVSRVGFVEVDDACETASITYECTDGTVAPALGTHRLADYGAGLAEALCAGRTLVISDVFEDPLTRAGAAAHATVGTRSLLAVPLVRDGRLRAILHLSHREPRVWSAGDVDLMREVALRTWSAAEQARAEAALRENEARLRLAQEAAAIGIYDYGIPADRIFWDARVRELWGVSEDLPVTYAVFAAGVHPDDLPRVEADVARALSPGGDGTFASEYRVTNRRDGVTRIIAATGRAIFEDGRATRLTGTVRDVTAERAAEAELAALNAELQRRVAEVIAERDSAWRNARDMIVLVDLRGVFLSVNPAATAILGWTEAELVGRSCFDFIHPDDIAASNGALAHATAGPLPLFENRYRHKNGGWRVISWVAAPEANRIFAYGRDVTAEREQARLLAETQAQLAHAQRMEALGQLAGGIAHDINNVLQAVGGGAALIERRPADPESVRRIARMVIEAAERGSSVTRRLLAFSRRGDLRAEPLDPLALLADMREILTHSLGTGIGVRVEAPPALPPVMADKGQLETVLVNLATNARDAMDGQGTLTLAASIETRAEGDASLGRQATLRPGGYLRLSVIDTGAGMAPEVLARATEPFFTTKPRGKGTGLGLAMARGFAEQSGGTLLVESEKGRGTCVTLWLPLAEGAPAAALPPPAVAEAGAPTAHARRILLVDDDAPVREITAQGLEAAGYAVRTAPDGGAALAMLDAGEAVDLLVSDLSMPGMDGLAVIRAAQRRRPDLPAILLTGFATGAAELALDGAMSGTFSLLRKPITAAALSERVALLLEAAPAKD